MDRPPQVPECQPVEGTYPTRVDQRTPCPKCGSWKCPSINGSKNTIQGRRRFRKCENCGHAFVTLQPPGSTERRQD